MYRGRLWTMRQFAGFGTAEETNERFRYLLEHGQTGSRTAFDMPSLMGTTPTRRGRWARSGARASRSTRSTTCRRCSPGSTWRGERLDDDQRSGRDHARLLRRRGRAQGVTAERLGGTIQADILKEYIAQKEWCFPIDPAMRLRAT
jgi:methylmalonyl-CoA mutase N-terminal domain/subunit